MKRWHKFLGVLLLAAALAPAKEFMGLPIEEENLLSSKPLPTWILGGGLLADYCLSEFNIGTKISFGYRLHKHHSIDLESQYYFIDNLFETGVNWRFYFLGSLMSRGHDDFLRLGFSGIYMEKNDDSYVSPTVTFGYGRDILFFDSASLLGRVEISGKYLIGEPVSRKKDRALLTQSAHAIICLDFSLLFF